MSGAQLPWLRKTSASAVSTIEKGVSRVTPLQAWGDSSVWALGSQLLTLALNSGCQLGKVQPA